MAVTTAWTNPGTTGTDTSVGTITWGTTSNATSSNDVWTNSALSTSADDSVIDNSIKLVVAGAIAGTSQSTGTAWPAAIDAYQSYGSSSNTWGQTLYAANVNATNFGVGISCKRNGSSTTSHYLTCTNFGFALPAGTRVTGIEMQFERNYTNSLTCLPGGTRILTPTGERTIESLLVGDSVSVFNPATRRLESGVITRHGATNSIELCAVVTSRSVLVCTPTHRLRLADGRDVPAKSVQYDDILLAVKNGVTEEVGVQCVERFRAQSPVYQIDVEPHNLYLANGIVVHNGAVAGFTTAWIDHVQMKLTYKFLTPVGNGGRMTTWV